MPSYPYTDTETWPNLADWTIYGSATCSVSGGELQKSSTSESRLMNTAWSGVAQEDQKIRLKYKTSTTLSGRYSIYLKCESGVDPSTNDYFRAIVNISQFTAGTIQVDQQVGGVYEEVLKHTGSEQTLPASGVGAQPTRAHLESAYHYLELEITDNEFAVRWTRGTPPTWTYDSGMIAVSPWDNRTTLRFLGRWGKFASGDVGIMFQPDSTSHRIADVVFTTDDNPRNPPPTEDTVPSYQINPLPYSGAGSSGVDDLWPGKLWRPGHPSNFWNTTIPDDAVVHPDSDAIVTSAIDDFTAGTGVGHLIFGYKLPEDDFSVPIYFAADSDPLYTLIDTEEYGGYWPHHGTEIRCPVDAVAAGGGDGHIYIVQPDGTGWGLFRVTKDDGAHELVCSAGGRTGDFTGLHTVSGVNGTPYESWVPGDTPTSIYSRNQRVEWSAVSSNTDPLLGHVWPDEWINGSIRHKTTLVLKCNGLGETGRGYVYPTTHGALKCENLDPGEGGPLSMTDRSANGYLWRLAYTLDEIAALGLPEWQTTLLNMFRTYGCLVTDTGGAGVAPIRGLSGLSWTSFGYDDPYYLWGYDLVAAETPSVNFDADGQIVFRLRDNWDPYAWEVIQPAEGAVWP